MSKLVIRAVGIDETDNFETLIIGYADDKYGEKKAVMFGCRDGRWLNRST